MLSCLFAEAKPLRSAHFGPGTGPVHIRSASCDGSEQRIVDCKLQRENKCVHSEDAGVNCSCKIKIIVITYCVGGFHYCMANYLYESGLLNKLLHVYVATCLCIHIHIRIHVYVVQYLFLNKF